MPVAMRHVISICGECDGAGADLVAALDGQLPNDVAVRLSDCMNVCSRPLTLAARAKGKAVYLFGDVTRADAPGIIAFAKLYTDAPDGIIQDARPLGPLRMRLIGRIPPQ
ncbi:MAG: DUF1636 family protein [Pseudooceanicola sp.]